MKKVRVTRVQIPALYMRFLKTFLTFSKLISSLKAQVGNIWKNYLANQFFFTLQQTFKNYTIHKLFLNKFAIFINKQSMTGTKFSPTVPNLNLPSNDEITRFDGSKLPEDGRKLAGKVSLQIWIPAVKLLKQCWGSGSGSAGIACFWTLRIWIHFLVRGTDPDPAPDTSLFS